ncbi:MAG: hypothetical protein D6731_06335 [Planctomycetota bacterium]|nr:MAG: hypothetical protein D6731_06335 [Planctomycetota bacterium]
MTEPPRPLRVAFLALDPDSASARVRVLDRLPGLARLGVAGHLVGWPRGARKRRRLLSALGEEHAVVLHRLLLGESHAARLRRRVPVLVLDADDAVHLRPSGRPGGPLLGAKLRATLDAVDAVACGNATLRDAFRSVHPRVRLLLPACPAQELAPRSPAAGPLRLVWTGSRSTLPYLEAIGPALARLRDRVRLTVLADRSPRLPLPCAFTPWSLAAEERALRAADVGLYPLPDDPWAAGKSGYKLYLYMHHGLVSVASPRGGSLEALAPPEAGLLAEGPAGWEQALARLSEDRKLLAHMSLRARRRSLALHGGALRERALAALLRSLWRNGGGRAHPPQRPGASSTGR